MEIAQGDILLCEFYFSDLASSKKRPVLVFKDNLPFNDFVAIPISSKIEKMQKDEIFLENCHFQVGSIPRKSKLMIRKTFVASKDVVIKKYGSLANQSLQNIHKKFCEYFACYNTDKSINE